MVKAGQRRRTRLALRGGAVALAVALPLAFAPSGEVANDLVLAVTYAGMALGLNLIVGFAGLLDLGYVAFFAVGAYVAGYFASGFWENAGTDGVSLLAGANAGLPGIHVNFLVVLVLAALATALAGALIGLPTLRLHSGYIAVVTLAFGEIVGRIVDNGDQIDLLGGTLTAGRKGITPIDKIDLPFVDRFGAIDLRPWYWFALALALAAVLVNVRLRDSRVGRAWMAMREDETAAASAGVPIVRVKLLAYATGAAFGGIFGAFLASYLNTVNADQFAFSFSVFIFAMVVVGGMGSIPGVMLAAALLSVLNTFLLPDVLHGLPGRLGLDFDLSEVSSGIYGLLLVLVVVLRPQGLIPQSTRHEELA